MGYYNEFPHTRGYDGDLGWLIKMYKELLARYKTNNEYLDEINQQIENMTEQQLQEWLNDGTLENLISKLGRIVRYYDTTTLAISDSSLQSGQIVITKGKNSVNDYGNAIFIVSDTEVSDFYNVTTSSNKFLVSYNNVNNYEMFDSIENAIKYSDVLFFNNNYSFNNGDFNINKSIVIDFNNYTITLNPTSDSYVNLITVSNGNVLLKNGNINGNYTAMTPTTKTNFTGILLTSNNNITVENMTIYYNLFEGILANGNGNYFIKNCHIYDNGRNDIAILQSNSTTIQSCLFDSSLITADTITNLDFEPYQDVSVGKCIVSNCIFNTNNRIGLSCYLDGSTSKYSNIVVTNCQFNNNGVRISYDRSGLNSYLINNCIFNGYYKETNQTGALTFYLNSRNTRIVNCNFYNCDTAVSFNQGNPYSVISNTYLDVNVYNNGIISFTPKLSGSTNPYAYNNIKIKTNIYNISNWQYVNNLEIENPVYNATTSLTLNFNSFYSMIIIDGYSLDINIDGIYTNEVITTPLIKIYTNASNKISSTHFPSGLQNIGTNGIQGTSSGCNLFLAFRYAKISSIASAFMMIENLIGTYTAVN